MAWRRYPAYRDSGVEWLGEVPEGWDVVQLKRIVEIAEGQVDPASEDFLNEILVAPNHIESGTGRLLFTESAQEQGAESGKYCFSDQDVLYSKIRPHLRKACYPRLSGICSADMYPLRPKGSLIPEFLLYLLICDYFSDYAVLESLRVAMPKINRDALGFCTIVLPSPSEQYAIAAFLERETARIDALIAKKERLIALLQEKRAALISRAVTKGLDPSAPVKDSGIAWLGEVPAHREALKLTRVASLHSGHTPSRFHPEYWENCTIPWISLGDVWQLRSGRLEYIEETKEKISELGLRNSAAELLPAGTVILSRTASVGFSGIMATSMTTTQDYANWVCGPRLLPEYLLQVLRCMKSEFERLTMGSTHQTIYMPDIEAFRIPLPPIEEQQEIVQHVRSIQQRSERLEDSIAESIRLAQEYRTALISAAVTGKIDVRGEVPG